MSIQRSVKKQEESFFAYYDELKKYCHFISGNKWDGEDLVHDTLMKSIQKYGKDISYKKALLKKIAYHHWIDLNRKRGNEVISNEQQEESYLSSSSENRQEAITYLFDRLTAKQTVIYLLKEVFLFQIKEIAEIMKSSETAVKASLHRSKKVLGNKDRTFKKKMDSIEETETGLLLEAIDQAVYCQDPEYLIQLIPVLRSLKAHTTQVQKMSLSALYLAV